MGKKIYLLRVTLSFLAIFLLVAPMNVSAAYHMDYWEQLGMSYEEYTDELDKDGVHTFYPPTTYEASDLYIIEEDIKLSSGGILYDCFNASGANNFSGTMAFGEAKAWGSTNKIILTLYNSGSPLFTNGGTFNAELYVYSTNVSLTVARGSNVVTQVIDANSTEIHYVPISVNNTNADITKIEIIYNGGVPQSPGGIISSAGIMKYGYILNDEEENHSKNIFELLRDWTGNFFGNMMDSLNNYDGTGVNDASSKFDQSAGELDSVESDLTNITNSSIETYTDSAFDTSVIASLGSSLVYVVTWFTNFWNMGGLFSSILNVGLALSVAFFILRLRGGD